MDRIESTENPAYEEVAVPVPGTADGSGAAYRISDAPGSQLGRSTVRILRLPQSDAVIVQENPQHAGSEDVQVTGARNPSNRRRSSSEPHRRPYSESQGANLARSQTRDVPMSPVAEEGSRGDGRLTQGVIVRPVESQGRLRRLSASARSALTGGRSVVSGATEEQKRSPNEYETEVVNLLDVVDPQVSALTTLTNVQNSLFVPNLGRIVNRRPTYILAHPAQEPPEVPTAKPEDEPSIDGGPTRPPVQRTDTITSDLSERRYAVLPHGFTLEGWSDEDKRELNDHVRHMLHSRRSKFKRGLKGFGQYVSKPLGFLITLYATLITLFGLAWVLFLIGWISVGSKQLYMINVIDNVLVALFAIMGDGLAPFRAIDTYHMVFIAHYHHLTWRIRREKALPKLQDKNDLPVTGADTDVDLEAGTKQKSKQEPNEEKDNEDKENEREEQEKKDYNAEFSVLTLKQQTRLTHHQTLFAKSHTFYKPHETITHTAFPLRILVAVVVLLDCHSLFQIALGACTWGISYHVRPFALTTVILCCSITCNITAGILISVGDRMTRKKEVIEKMFRQELTEEAMAKMEKEKQKKEKEAEKEAEKEEKRERRSQSLELLRSPWSNKSDKDESKERRSRSLELLRSPRSGNSCRSKS